MKLYTKIMNDVMHSGNIDLGEVLYEKDRKTFRHCQRVFDYCFIFGMELDLSLIELEYLAVAAFFHDVGKLAISKEILDKPGTLTDEEMVKIMSHPRISAVMLRGAGGNRESVKISACHHERYDGKGYPYGLCGENIPFLSRILAVADTFDAMTSKNFYSEPLEKDEAISRLALSSGTEFDPEITGAFIAKIEAARVYLLEAV